MKSPVTIALLGEPVAASRPRFTRKGQPYNTPEKRNNTAALQYAASEAMRGRAPFDEPLRMDIEVQFAIPASWSQQKRERALRGEIRPKGRPDLSNVIKQVEDGFNKIVFRDDALIVEYGRARKVYSNQPKIIVTVRPIAPTNSGPLADMVRDLPNDTLDDLIDGAPLLQREREIP